MGGKGGVYQGGTKVVETVLQCKERRVVPIQGGTKVVPIQGGTKVVVPIQSGTKVVVPIQGGTKVVPTQGISSADQSCNFGRREATRGGGTIVPQLTLWIITLSYYNTFGIPTFWYFWYSDT